MSMDDPGWGEEIPDEPSATAVGTKEAKPRTSGMSQPSRNQLIIGVAVVVVIIVVIALLVSGHSKKTPSTTPTTNRPAATSTTEAGPSVADAAKNYVELETPAYNSLTAFGSVVSTWGTTAPTQATAQTAANPAILAFKTFSAKLLQGSWPASVQPEINTLASQVEVVANDLGDVSLAIANGTNAQWAMGFGTDADKLIDDVNAVRSKLKLPPLSSS
jgi:hypothetical protein